MYIRFDNLNLWRLYTGDTVLEPPTGQPAGAVRDYLKAVFLLASARSVDDLRHYAAYACEEIPGDGGAARFRIKANANVYVEFGTETDAAGPMYGTCHILSLPGSAPAQPAGATCAYTIYDLASRPLVHPGEILADELAVRHLTRRRLSQMASLPPTAFGDFINNQRSAKTEFAMSLEAILGTPSAMWLCMQSAYEQHRGHRDTRLLSKMESIRQAVRRNAQAD